MQSINGIFLKPCPIQSVQRSLNLLFQRTFFMMCTLFEKYRNLLVSINKMGNSVVYHPFPSRLASRLHPFMFFKAPQGLISPQDACWIFSNLYILPCVGKIFQFMAFTFLENTLNLCIFTHVPVPHSKLQAEFFENLFPPR